MQATMNNITQNHADTLENKHNESIEDNEKNIMIMSFDSDDKGESKPVE